MRIKKSVKYYSVHRYLEKETTLIGSLKYLINVEILNTLLTK